jgi:hypothetical protein
MSYARKRKKKWPFSVDVGSHISAEWHFLKKCQAGRDGVCPPLMHDCARATTLDP